MRDSLNNSFINLHISDGNQHGIFFGADQFPFYHYFHLGDAQKHHLKRSAKSQLMLPQIINSFIIK